MLLNQLYTIYICNHSTPLPSPPSLTYEMGGKKRW